MILERLKWALRILNSDTYVVLTDKSAVVNIPLMNPDSIQNVILLSAQTASLNEFKDRLEDTIHEHEDAIELLLRQRRQPYTRKKNAKTTSAGTTKTSKTKGNKV